MAVSSSTVLRVRGLPSNRNIDEVTSLLESSLQVGAEASGLKITSLAEDPYQAKRQVATLVFLKSIPPLFDASTANEWSITNSESDGDQALTLDTHFRGLTALNTPRLNEKAVDCVAVCGLGGHAFGSFKEKGTSYMWLRDSLPKDLPNLRILLYGYESRLDESDSNQNITVIADSFVGHLSQLRSHPKPIATPLVIIAHSLGGLVVKQAIMKLGRGNDLDKKQMESVVGMLFFGVPNRGMDIESLQSIVCDRQNRYLLESVGQYSDLLLQQDGQFGSTFHFEDSPIVSFFETKSSPTAIKVNDSWKMAGPKKVLVNRFSATRPRLWEWNDEPFNRTHSDLVKFAVHDVDYESVLCKLREIACKASVTLTSRYLSQESPDALNADEEACLRSLSFPEIYARENIIEPAIQDTGSWLLESQNFQDWVQRKRLDKHRGFFWIQGNPGSGKSTLIKKVYSHITAYRQEPSSVIAAFFFNARGNQIEKSPTGLFRTLLHTLCQRISALRDLVVKSYVKKRRLLNSDWQWQLSELKDFLAAVVTSPVLGQRSLLIFVDALDECDLAATQSVIDIYEDLARSSLLEGTNFSICLSSRYWPQFRIPNCFIARVELENKADIVTYIQKRLESTHINENLGLHAALKAEILDKAKGTFLWVVLVTRDLLQANTAGATLRELRDIVRTVPPGLSEFYQHQLQSTEGEDRGRMLRLLQVVFYAQRPLSPTELRYALAFGCRAYASYAEWSQSSEFVSSNEQMAKRIRGHSKGLVEITPSSEQGFEVVQLIHQSVRDFLTAGGFSFLRDSGRTTQSAEGHEYLKTACLNYLIVKDLEIMSELEFKVGEQFWDQQRHMPNLVVDHPLLDYVVLYIFPHAAQAEQLGIAQDSFRTHMCGNIQGCFDRWRYFHDMLKSRGGRYPQGPGARPIHVLAQYGLLTKEIAEKERNINIESGAFGSALVAACWGGHQDAVEILLQFGADPRFDASHCSGSHNWIWHAWKTPMAPFTCAVYNQDLPVLRQLLNHQRSFPTLQERLHLSNRAIRGKTHQEALLALLFPEATFPDSAIDYLCEALGNCTLEVFSFLLNRSNDSIVHEKMLWHSVFSSSYNEFMSKTIALLDRGGRVEITAALLDCSNEYQSVGGVLSLLLEQDCEVEMTEDLVDSISQFENSSQIVRTFEAKGYQFDPFTPKQLLCALRSGSAETAAFFLQRQDGKTSADEMLQSALSNESNGEEVARLLLGYLNPDHIDEQAIIAALANSWCGDDLFKLLHSRWSSLTFSEAALASAVSTQDLDVIKTVLDNCECVRITERILTEATVRDRDFPNSAADVVELLLLRDPDVNVSESSVIGAIRNSIQAFEILDVLRRHRKSLLCTEDIVAAAAESDRGPDALDIILHQDRSAKISSSMIMTAMRAKRAAALISVMLQHDNTIVVNEEHLVAAASNPCGPITIFAFLQMKGKLDKASPASEGINTGPAKRRRISQNSSPRISTEVINAAFSNPKEGAQLQLLELFIEWGIITEADCNHRLYNARARFTIPSISQLFPGI